jgi:hypothetical protein
MQAEDDKATALVQVSGGEVLFGEGAYREAGGMGYPEEGHHGGRRSHPEGPVHAGSGRQLIN